MSNGGKPVRVRFSPSPTGHLHIGNLRAAIFNWLFARHHNGTFLIRIEDTDRERSKPEYVESILQAFDWMGLTADEPIVTQSKRIDEHTRMIQQLLDEGKAYRCYCSPEELIARAPKIDGKESAFIKYDGFCRERSDESGKSFVVRFKLPAQESVTFNDLIRGPITVGLDQLDDFIIARSDGSPMYNFVVVVDDAFMKITQIIRGEDHISNTPKQILLYQAFGFGVPEFAHLPMILGPSGDRLSKRDAATSVLDYKTNGYMPDALLNYLVRLGWAHGDQEIFSRDEIIKLFSLDNVGKKGAIFDPQKLDWLNGVYIRQTADEELLERITGDVEPELLQQLSSWQPSQIHHLIALYKERAKTLRELADELALLHAGPTSFDQKAIEKWTTSDTVNHLGALVQKLDDIDTFSVELVNKAVKDLCEELGLKLVKLAQPIRIALVGKAMSPGVFELLVLVGKSISVSRLRSLQEFLKKR